MIRKKSVVIWAFAAFAGVLLAVTPNLQGGDKGRIRFDGAWLVSNPEIGIRGVEHISSIDPSGKRLSFTVHMLSGDPTAYGLCPEADYISAGAGEAVRTGPSTVDATILIYAMRKELPRDEIECIWEMTGSSTFTRETQDAVINFAIYPMWMDPAFYPYPDTDDDMIPDEDAPPFACIPVAFQAKRVPIMLPCE